MALRRWPRKSLLQLSALRHRGLKLFHASSFAPESESVQDSRADSLGAAPDPQAVARVDKAPPAVLQRRSYQDHTPPMVYLDTHSEITRLQSAGYTLEQAESLVSLLNNTLRTTVAPMASSNVTLKELELLEMRMNRDIEGVKSGVVLLEKSTVQSLRNENESLKVQMKRLLDSLKEEVGKVQAGVRLDLNLEKSRAREELTTLDQAIKDTKNTIDKEVAQLKTQIETQKLESIKYLAGSIFSIVTIMLSVVLGLWRLMK